MILSATIANELRSMKTKLLEASANFQNQKFCFQSSLATITHAGRQLIPYENSGNNRPNRPRFVLPISSHVTILLGSFSIILLFAFMAQLCTVRNLSEKSIEVLSKDSSHDLKWV